MTTQVFPHQITTYCGGCRVQGSCVTRDIYLQTEHDWRTSQASKNVAGDQ